MTLRYLDISQWGEVPTPPIEVKPGTYGLEFVQILLGRFGLECPVTERKAFTVVIEPDDWHGTVRA